MLDQRLSWFRSPHFDDPQKTQIASLLNDIALVSLIGALFFGLWSLFVAQNQVVRGLVMIIVVVAELLILMMLRRGYVRQASLVIVFGMWVVSTAWIVLLQGLADPSYLGYVLIILIAGYTLGHRWAYGVTGLSVLTGLIILMLEYEGVLPLSLSPFNLSHNWISGSLIFLIAAVLVQRTTGDLKTALSNSERHAQALERRNRAYQVLSAGNQSLVRARDEDSLLQNICDILVDHGGYDLAWIELHQGDDEAGLKPVAIAGGDLSDVAAAKKIAGPPSMADGLPDARLYRQSATDQDYRAIIALALKTEESDYGALNVGSLKPGVFDHAEVDLLQEMASDVAFGTSTLRARERQQQMEADLRYHADLLDQVSDVIVSRDQDRLIKSWNKAAELRYGVSASEAIGKQFSELISTEYTGESREEIYRKLKEVGAWEGEVKHHLGDGRALDILVSLTTVTNAEGEVLGSVGVSRDITESKQAERALHISEERLQRFLNSTTDAISIFDADLNLVEINPVATAIADQPRDTLMGKNMLELTEEVRSTGRYEQYLQVHETGVPFVIEDAKIPTPNGIRIAQIKAFKVGDGLALVASDVTELRQAERERERFFEISPDVISIRDLNGNLIQINPAMSRITGYGEDEILDNDSVTWVHPDDMEKTGAAFRELANGTSVENLEIRTIAKDGSVKWLSWNAVPFVEEGIIYGIARDITRHIESEARLALFLEATIDGVALFDADLNMIEVNHTVTSQMGLPRDQLLGRNIAETAPHTLENGRYEQLQNVVKTGEPLIYQDQLIGPGPDSPRRYYIEMKAFKVGDGLGLVSTDITELRHAQRERERFFEMSNDAMCIIDHEGNFIQVNPALSEILGYSQEELIGANPIPWMLPEHREEGLTALSSVAQGDRVTGVELPYRAKDGSVKWVSWSAVPYLEEGIIFAVGRDMTQRKLDDETLRTNRERLESFLESTTDAILIFDADLNLVEANPVAIQLVTGSWDELVGRTLFDLTADVRDTGRYEQYLQVQKTGVPIVIEDAELPRENSKRIAQIKAFQVGDGLGLVITDVTELRHTERERERFFTMASDAMCIADLDGHFIQVNPALSQILGYSEEELIGARSLDWILPEYLESGNAAVSSGAQGQASVGMEFPYRAKDGSVKWISWSAVPLLEEGIVFAVGRDMTDIRAAQAAMIEAERLEAELQKERELSELKNWFMSLVSHEFRTPLTIIQSSSEIINRYWDRMPEDKRQSHLGHITSQVNRLNAMLSDFSLVIHAQEGRLNLQPEAQDLLPFCQAIVTESEIAMKSQHQLHFTSPDRLPMVLFDSRLLGYVLRNLLSNAVKYSPEGGEVHLDLEIDDDQLIFHVRDQGIGIPPKDLEHIFEYYRRANNVGNIRGTGVGLNIARLCVESHGVQISVESTIGEGSTFTVSLPLLPVQQNVQDSMDATP